MALCAGTEWRLPPESSGEITGIRTVRAAPIYNHANGEFIGAIESLRDITEYRSMERALLEQHQKSSSLLDGSPVSSFVIDCNRRVTAWNMVNEYFTGIPKGDILGKPIDLSPLFKEKTPPTLAELLLEMTDEEIMKRYEGIRKSGIHPQAVESVGSIWIKGEEHVMAIQATRLCDTAGAVIGAIQCAQDMTRQRRYEEALKNSEEKYKSLMENASDAILLADPDGNIVEANRSAEELLGYKKDELIRKHFSQLHPLSERERTKAAFDELIHGGRGHFSGGFIQTKDGEIFPVDITGSMIEFGGRKVIQAFFRDISQYKQAEDRLLAIVMERSAELTRKNEELELEIKERRKAAASLKKKTKALKHYTDKLKETNIALQVLLKQRESDKNNLEEQVAFNVKELMLPQIDVLKKGDLPPTQRTVVRILEANLNEIVSPFAHKLSSKYYNLTPREIEIANLIRHGKSTKEITNILRISTGSIMVHRNHIRRKLGVISKKVNLRTHLLSLA
jgi:PAS domain S-box-containing protein